MDDNMKIRVLMIYFSHWGSEEARIYRNKDGARRFMEQVHHTYGNRRETALDVLRDKQMTEARAWRSLVECLLPITMSHWVEYYDYMTKPLYIKIKFSEQIGVAFHDLYQLDLDDNQRKNLNAIIALPCLS